MTKSQPKQPQLTLPADKTLELSLLGTIASDKRFLPYLTLLSEDWFTFQDTKLAYRALRELVEESSPISQLTIAKKLEELHADSPMTLAVNLFDQSISYLGDSGWQWLFKQAESYYLKRELLKKLYQRLELVSRNGFNPVDQIQEIMAELSELLNLAKTLETVGEEPRNRDLDSVIAENRGALVCEIPWAPLRQHVSSIRSRQFWVIAGSPGSGKTSLAANLAWMSAVIHHKRVLFVTLEASANSLYLAMISQMSGVPVQMLDRMSLLDDDLEKVEYAWKTLQQSELWLSEYTAFTPAAVASKAEALVSKIGGVDLIVVDYLQLLRANKRREKRYEEIASITSDLLHTAKRLNAALLVTSQLNRAYVHEKRDPGLHDLRDSGTIEQDADVVLILSQKVDRMSNLKLIVAKNRFGPVGNALLKYHGPTRQFFDPDFASYSSQLEYLQRTAQNTAEELPF